MIINPTLGGQAVRLRLSNLVGTQPVRFENISIAKGNPLLPNIDESTRVPLTVNGRDFGVAMPGQELITDVAEFAFNSQEDLAITFHVAGESGPMTWHAVSFGPQYISPHNSGDVTRDSLGTSFSQVSVGWFFLSGLDAFNPQTKGAIVAIGDSITDGFLQVLNQRWTDRLAMRLNAQNANVAVLNQGINSNTVTAARSGFAGPPLLERFQRDVIDRAGVKGVIIFEGTNDLGADVKAEPVIQAYQQLIQQARSSGLCLRMEETAIEQVKNLGFKVSDVKHIVPTHLDLDHAGGLSDFPGAQVHVFEPEHRHAIKPSLRDSLRFRKAQFEHQPKWTIHEKPTETWFGFQAIRPVAGIELLMVPLIGHTRGHVGVAVKNGNKWILHCGDAYFHRSEVALKHEDPMPAGVAFFEKLVQTLPAERVATQARLRELLSCFARMTP
eukprot:gene10353-10160_t